MKTSGYFIYFFTVGPALSSVFLNLYIEDIQVILKEIQIGNIPKVKVPNDISSQDNPGNQLNSIEKARLKLKRKLFLWV